MGNLWRARHAAVFLEVSRSHVYDLAKKGKLPHVKLGGRVIRFVPEELARWVRENSHPAVEVSK